LIAGRYFLKDPTRNSAILLLDPKTVDEAVIGRATAQNPEAAMKLQQLSEIRAMQVSVAGIAAADVRAALNGQ
jgi:hypothetical protein